MQSRYAAHPDDARFYTTERLRQDFLAEGLMMPDKIQLVYSHYDRFIIGGICPTTQTLKLETHEMLRATYFLERREIGIINVGQTGTIKADGKEYTLANKECLYIGKGTQSVEFLPSAEARYFISSAPAHAVYPATHFTLKQAEPLEIGSPEQCNQRTVYKFIHEKGIASCQLVMGLTVFASGSTWNTMPSHRHERRMEAYFYFDLDKEARVIHFMGEPTETRHLFVANEQAIISPPWSLHFGTATGRYAFIWAMAGENKDYTDMDKIEVTQLR